MNWFLWFFPSPRSLLFITTNSWELLEHNHINNVLADPVASKTLPPVRKISWQDGDCNTGKWIHKYINSNDALVELLSDVFELGWFNFRDSLLTLWNKWMDLGCQNDIANKKLKIIKTSKFKSFYQINSSMNLKQTSNFIMYFWRKSICFMSTKSE